MILPFTIENYEKHKGAPGFEVRTRDGDFRRVLCVDNLGDEPIVVTRASGQTSTRYANGRIHSHMECGMDLQIVLPDPAPVWRPWRNAGEVPKLPLQVRFKDSPKHHRTYISAANDDVVWLGNASSGISHEDAFKELEQLDGTPCGILETEGSAQ